MNILSLLSDSPILALAFLLSIIAAITVHEFAHAWTAYRLGDDTPYLEGRVTLSPAAHLDPVGSLMFLLLGFGWGRPVVYNPMRLARRVDELLVALAGPASNLIFALVLNLLAFAVGDKLGSYGDFLQLAARINVTLAAFNMIPIPPLDGSSIVAHFWPEYRSMVGGQIGVIILLALIFVPVPGYGNLIGLIVGPLAAAFGSLTHLFGLI